MNTIKLKFLWGLRMSNQIAKCHFHPKRVALSACDYF